VKKAVSSEKAQSLNAEVIRQGNEKEIEKLRTEKMEGRFHFYFHPNTLKCVAISGMLKVLKTPYGISVGWRGIGMGIQRK